jgi:hypothetical protein
MPNDLEVQRNTQIQYQLGFVIMMIAIYKRERMFEAAEQFRKVLQIEPHYHSAHFLGQILLFDLPDRRKALLLADEIEKSFPTESEHIRQMVSMFKIH